MAILKSSAAARRLLGRPSPCVGREREIRRLLEMDYPHADFVTLVCDNLNTHDIASLYATFDAETAHHALHELLVRLVGIDSLHLARELHLQVRCETDKGLMIGVVEEFLIEH